MINALIIALIDADIVLYRAGYAAQHKHYFVYVKDEEEFGWVASFMYKKDCVAWINNQEDLYIVPEIKVEPLSHAIQNMVTIIKGILRQTKTSNYKLYLSGDNNFRDKIATIRVYKGNRDPDDKPAHYKAMRKYLIEHWDAEVVDGMEADDALGIHQTRSGCHIDDEEISNQTIICTIDKDLDMIPGMHYNFVKKEMYVISSEQAMYNFYTQLLTGDSIDNIEGVPGIGPVRAKKLLIDATSEQDMFEVVFKTYQDKFPGEGVWSRILETGKLLWIMREPNKQWSLPDVSMILENQDSSLSQENSLRE